MPELPTPSMNPPSLPSTQHSVKFMISSGESALPGVHLVRATPLVPGTLDYTPVSMRTAQSVQTKLDRSFALSLKYERVPYRKHCTNWPKAALDSRPPTGDEQYVQVENVVTVAGATARHGLILQFNVGFLSGNNQKMTNDDITESYLRANVGYTRATNSLLVASPLDMAGLPGVFDQLDAGEISDADWNDD